MAASAVLRDLAKLQETHRSEKGTYWRGELRRLLLENSPFVPHTLVEGQESDGHQRFRARPLRFADERDVLDGARFAVCCFPLTYGPGIRSHYVLANDGVIWKKDLGHAEGISRYPPDPALEGWAPLTSPSSAKPAR